MNEYLEDDQVVRSPHTVPLSVHTALSVGASSSTEASASPFRRSRFEGRTRRQALERRFGKADGESSPSRTSDDRCALHETVEESRPAGARLEQDNGIRTPPRRDQQKGYCDQSREQRAFGEFPFPRESGDDEKKSSSSTTVTTATASSATQQDLTKGPYTRLSNETDALTERMRPQDVEGQHEMPPPPNRPQHQTEANVKYYRVVYRGVVAVLSAPDAAATRSGSYLGYGEIFSSRYEVNVDQGSIGDADPSPKLSPRVGKGRSAEFWQSASPPRSLISDNTGSVSSLDTLTASTVPPVMPTIPGSDLSASACNGNTVIRVDLLLTGGYAMDAPDGSQPEPNAKTPKRSNAHYLALGDGPREPKEQFEELKGFGEGACVGFLFAKRKDLTIVEPLSTIPSSEEGRFHYKIMSSTPLPILTGPALDAPKTKAMVLPGTVHEVSLRVSADPDGDGTMFLRLSHRRGWIVDRKNAAKKGRPTQAVPVVKEVGGNDSLADDGSLSGISSIAASVATPCSNARRRHRVPRRRLDASKDTLDKGSLPPRQIMGKFPPTSTPVKMGRSHLDSGAHEKSMTPSSNVSIMSDDSSMAPTTSRHIPPTSPDVSYTTNRSISSASSATTTFFLMRVTAPRGLKILDAPQFQVNNLIHGKNTGGDIGGVASSHMVSQFESNMAPPKTHHSIFQTMSGRLATAGPSKTRNPAVFDSGSRIRILPRGAVFEASRRMESSGAYSQGAGLIKLSDNSGWAIVPRQDELDHQYRNYHGGVAGVKEGEATRAFEEVGNAVIENLGHEAIERGPTTSWVRVSSRTGLAVSCPPPVAPTNDGEPSPTSSRGSSAISSIVNGSAHGSNFTGVSNNESDVASSVGSAFLDAMFRTPKKNKERENHEQLPPTRYPANIEKQLLANTIACGTSVEVEKWQIDSSTHQEYARLRGGQGWIPLEAGGRPAVMKVPRPDFRFGSFWFRVQSSRGIKVRLGPSRKASSIKSEEGIYYRFECGEFLRASEIMTVFSDEGQPTECFAKLYRNRHVRLHSENDEYRQLPSLTTQAEWVQVFGRDELYLEECAVDPRIERHKQGWRYNVVPDLGVTVRRGPSFAAEATGIVLLGGESVVINERVSLADSSMAWLRVKDGRGWVHDTAEDGTEIMLAHSLRHRRDKGAITGRPQKAPPGKKEEIAYNAIIARLFHNDVPGNAYRPPKDLKGLQG